MAVVLGVTPMVTTLLKDLEVKAAVQHNEMSSSCPVIGDVIPTKDDHMSLTSSADTAPPAAQQKPDCNVELERSGMVAPPLAARHAQNPTVERNTHRGSSEELTVDGNTLVSRRAADHAAAAAATDTAVTVSQPDQTQSRRLSTLRPDQLHRISYVQNAVDNAVPTARALTGPKRQNTDSQARHACDDDLGKPGVCVGLPANDDDDDDGGTSHNASAADAGDNLGYESSTSPSYEVASCVI